MPERRGHFKRIQKRLCDMQVIPFVGAGISMSAKNPSFPDFKPTLAYMKTRLIEKIKKEFYEVASTRSNNELKMLLSIVCPEDRPCILFQGILDELLDIGLDSKHTIEEILNRIKVKKVGHCNKLGIDSHVYLDPSKCCPPDCISFDRLAEVGVWLWGHDEVCKIVEIEKFAGLNPLPAHRYLAYLAREGLVTEIISTNYDCCIEKAFYNTFGAGRQDEGKETLAVIRNLNEYRQYGGCRFTNAEPHYPILHLYKINGCAKAYQDYLKSAKTIHTIGPQFEPQIADRILLTEQQLQAFRNENWTKELLRDRARTHTLVFSGFGSEEPQVRHTTLNLIQEFQMDTTVGNYSSPEEVAALPNAPFVAAYDRLNFTQFQILDAFTQAHLKRCCKGWDRVKAAMQNVFCENDVKEMDEAEDGKLSADLFWFWMYILGFSCLFDRLTSEGSAFLKWLDYHGVPARRWNGFLRNTLYPADVNSEEQNSLFGNVRVLLEIDENYPQGPLILWQWLAVMECPAESCHGHDWYLPLTEDPLLILVTLLFLITLVEKEGLSEIHKHVSPRRGLGLEVKFLTDSNSKSGANSHDTHTETREPRKVYLVSEASSGKLEPRDQDQVRYCRLIRRVAIPSLRYLDREKRWETISDRSKMIRSMRMGRAVTVAAGDIIQKAKTPERLREVLCSVAAADRPPRNPRLVPLNRSDI
ncbi:MAG TPA: hypothetical protein ENF70_02445 [Deltaproteobacteria bacterium]|nr:hypothetical protein [Deltaproteobacteria bacterium]